MPTCQRGGRLRAPRSPTMDITASRCLRRTPAPRLAPLAASVAPGQSRSARRVRPPRSATRCRALLQPHAPSGAAWSSRGQARRRSARHRPAAERPSPAGPRSPTARAPSRSQRGRSAGALPPRVALPCSRRRSPCSDSAARPGSPSPARHRPRAGPVAAAHDARAHAGGPGARDDGSAPRSQGSLPAAPPRWMEVQ